MVVVAIVMRWFAIQEKKPGGVTSHESHESVKNERPSCSSIELGKNVSSLYYLRRIIRFYLLLCVSLNDYCICLSVQTL